MEFLAYKKPGTVQRYGNLFRNVDNHFLYFRHKFRKRSELTFRTRKKGLHLTVEEETPGIFKAIFMNDRYLVRLLKEHLFQAR